MGEEPDTPQPAPPEEDEELSTTPPNPALETEEDTGWKMPEPVFRKTSGYLPKGFEKKLSQVEVKENVDDDTSTDSMQKSTGLVDVEPQPEFTDLESGEHEKPNVSRPRKKGGAAKVFFTVFGLLLLLLLIAALLAVVYFLYWARAANGTF